MLFHATIAKLFTWIAHASSCAYASACAYASYATVMKNKRESAISQRIGRSVLRPTPDAVRGSAKGLENSENDDYLGSHGAIRV